MASSNYASALKLGKKEIQSRTAAKKPAYLPALDEILDGEATRGEVPLGLIDIPTEMIAGTKTRGRTNSFAANFMPVLEEGTEFAMKWQSLCEAHISEGIRDPIIAYEYLNHYYVLEGNKRVSVLKFFGASSIPGYVTRIIPAWKDTKEIRIYYEFMDFYDRTNINYLFFSEEGSYRRLCRLLDYPLNKRWTFDERIDFRSSYIRFSKAFDKQNDSRIDCTAGDALLTYLFLFGYDQLKEESPEQILTNLKKCWDELELNLNTPKEEPKISLKMEPTLAQKKNIITSLLTPARTDTKIAFIHSKSGDTSNWTYAHELGRNYIDEVFHGQIETTAYFNNRTNEEALASIEQAIEEGNTLIFTTSPLFLSASITAAVNHPDVKILNCSVNASHKYIRTYYARMFEAKILSGVLAGILTDTDLIGYIADYPVAGMLANINAFAIGAKMVNPNARILLEWSTLKENQDVDLTERLCSRGANYISHNDILAPTHASRRFGLYRVTGEKPVNLAIPIWNWGKYYERIIQNIRHGTWSTENKSESKKAVTYWWGMSAGVVDLIWSESIPAQTKKLLSTLKNALIHYDLNPFAGEILSQDGLITPQSGDALHAEEVIYMNWLAENVTGSIPSYLDLIEEAQPFVHQEGVKRKEDI